MAGKDLSDKRFGRLVAIRPTDERDNGSVKWLCKCDCGSECVVSARNLTHGHTTSCGCARGKPVCDGERFGALVAIKSIGSDDNGNTIWECHCDCGNNTNAKGIDLRYGRITSCGCGLHQAKLAGATLGRVDGTCLDALTRSRQKNNTTGYKGVTIDKRSGRYIAQIKFMGKNRYLGSYATAEEAYEARREAEEDLFDPILEEYGRDITKQDDNNN